MFHLELRNRGAQLDTKPCEDTAIRGTSRGANMYIYWGPRGSLQTNNSHRPRISTFQEPLLRTYYLNRFLKLPLAKDATSK